jgi:hypothetical protein
MGENPSIATTPKSVIDRFVDDFDILRTSATPDFGVWVWSAPTRTSELPVKLPLLRILSYSALSRQ